MFRPVQNPDDEEAEGRVRTRTRTKELVIMSSFRFYKILFWLCVSCRRVFLVYANVCTQLYHVHAWNRSTPQSIH